MIFFNFLKDIFMFYGHIGQLLKRIQIFSYILDHLSTTFTISRDRVYWHGTVYLSIAFWQRGWKRKEIITKINYSFILYSKIYFLLVSHTYSRYLDRRASTMSRFK